MARMLVNLVDCVAAEGQEGDSIAPADYLDEYYSTKFAFEEAADAQLEDDMSEMENEAQWCNAQLVLCGEDRAELDQCEKTRQDLSASLIATQAERGTCLDTLAMKE